MPNNVVVIMGGIFLRFLRIIEYAILIRVILSWFIRDYSNPLVQIIFMITEPIIAPIRSLNTKLGLGGNIFDFSPLIAMLIIHFIERVIELVIL